jgi:hypothetical protein
MTLQDRTAKLSVLALFFSLQACSPTLKVEGKLSTDKDSTSGGTTTPDPVLSSVEIQSTGLVVQGSDLDSVTSIQLKHGGVTSNLNIDSKNASSLTASLTADMTVVLGGVYDVIINDASAASFTFNIPGVLTSCPTDMVLVPGATGYAAFCVEKDFREPYGTGSGGAGLAEANAICLQANRHLCSGEEWRRSCAAQPSGLNNLPDYYEWISDPYHQDQGTSGNARGMIIGDTGCNDLIKNVNPSDFIRFRCCSR